MDSLRHKTQKRHNYTPYQRIGPTNAEQLQLHLEQGAKDAYSRQWHRIERGLRLNRLRLFIEEISNDYAMNKEEKDMLFLFLQKALDKKLMNTLKVVQYDSDTQRILSIKGLSIKRNESDKLVFQLDTKESKDAKDAKEAKDAKDEKDTKKTRPDTTRKRKKDDMPSVSVPNLIPVSFLLDEKIETVETVETAETAETAEEKE